MDIGVGDGGGCGGGIAGSGGERNKVAAGVC